jgi:hypothetical protein
VHVLRVEWIEEPFYFAQRRHFYFAVTATDAKPVWKIRARRCCVSGHVSFNSLQICGTRNGAASLSELFVT